MCVITSLAWAIVIVIFVNALKGTIISVFSNDEGINQTIASAFPVLSIFVFFDCI